MDFGQMKFLFDNPNSSDVKLMIQLEDINKEMVMPGHSSILMCKSSVFHAMLLTKDFLEGKSGVVTVHVQGGIAVACNFVRFIYTEKISSLSLQENVQLLKTAHMYQVDALCTVCSNRILADITPNNICVVYSNIFQVASESLLTECQRFLCKCAFLIFRDNLHVGLNEEQMLYLIKSDCLNVRDENQVLDALWKWGYVQCLVNSQDPNNNTVKNHLVNILPHIRWISVVDKKEAEWHFLYSEYNSKELCSVDRMSNPEPSLILFAKVLCLLDYRVSFYPRNLKPPEKIVKLLTFSQTENTYLLGFQYDLYFQKDDKGAYNYAKQKLTINQEEINISRVKKTYEERFNEGGMEYWLCRFELELPKPLLVIKNTVHCISLTKLCEGHLISYPMFTGSTYFPSVAGEDCKTQILVIDNFRSIRKLYYFDCI